MDAGAPLLCAGITIYSPMKYYGMTEAAEGKNLGVVGLGGVGHVAVKIGKALGMRVTVISTSSHKEREAKESLGADDFLVSKDDRKMQVSPTLICVFIFYFLFQIMKMTFSTRKFEYNCDIVIIV